MNMMSGSLMENKYLNQNPGKSGFDIWRKLHYWNEPKTFNTQEFYRKKVENLARPQCKTYSEFAKRFEGFENACDQYLQHTNTGYNNESMLHPYIDMIPQEPWEHVELNVPMENGRQLYNETK